MAHELAIAVVLIVACLPQCSCGAPKSEASQDVIAMLDRLHSAASHADFSGYFDCFAPDGVFLGTDATERWSVDEFRAFCKPYFDKGQGWTYVPRKEARHVTISSDGSFAWFDELLDNAKYGECRGTGALRLGSDTPAEPKRWRIVQYHLSIPIPNAKAADIVALIKASDPAASASPAK